MFIEKTNWKDFLVKHGTMNPDLRLSLPQFLMRLINRKLAKKKKKSHYLREKMVQICAAAFENRSQGKQEKILVLHLRPPQRPRDYTGKRRENTILIVFK